MNIYLVERIGSVGYDEFDSFVIACKTEKEARETHPNEDVKKDWFREEGPKPYYYGSWVLLENTTVKLIGKAERGIAGIICSSFNAG